MDQKGTTRALQNLLGSWTFPAKDATSFPEMYAQQRYIKKMEVPDEGRERERRAKAFEAFINRDRSLTVPGRDVPDGDPLKGFLPGTWYRARHSIHKWCRDLRLPPMVFTNGSESIPTRGYNSLESKLMRSRWVCTIECFDLWAQAAYESMALKRATRKRFQSAMRRRGLCRRSFQRESWRLYRMYSKPGFECFKRMLRCVTFLTSYNRFSTVPKNNSEDRVIATEPLCNMLVQRRIGEALRNALREHTGRDLNCLADKHREMIACSSKATIDLSKASDGFHRDLIRFVFPKRVFQLLDAARAPFLLGPDKEFYSLNGMSSMGNGYTFDVMSFVLTAVTLEHDDHASVFGDDIIVANSVAREVISDLRAAGLTVNEEKSCIDSPFRESCGAVFHDAHGYLESYDFRYPKHIHDCIVAYNKAFLLGKRFASFRLLWNRMRQCVPMALRGPADSDLAGRRRGERGSVHAIDMSTYFWDTNPRGGLKVSGLSVKEALEDYHLAGEGLRFFSGFVWKSFLATPTTRSLRMKRHTGKYLMYLHSGKATPDAITGRGIWQLVTYVQVGQRAFRMKSLVRRKRTREG